MKDEKFARMQNPRSGPREYIFRPHARHSSADRFAVPVRPMKFQRRDFLKTTLTVSAAAALATRPAAAAPAAGAREYYELRAYKLKPGSARAGLDTYLAQGVLPALGQRGVGQVGVFTEIEVNKSAGTSAPKADSPVWMLIPYSSLETFVQVSAELNTDAAVLKAGGDYLQAKKPSPAFDRIDSWVLRAFRSMPKMEVPAFSKNKTATRVFEMRDYQSHSELAALNKMAMFDEGETDIMRSLGMSPLFFGQALSGPDLPHLRYITPGPDLATHLANWKKFGPDPRWVKMKDDPKWANNTSKNTARFLVPTSYSQL